MFFEHNKNDTDDSAFKDSTGTMGINRASVTNSAFPQRISLLG